MTVRRRALLTIYIAVILERFGFYAILAILMPYFRDLDEGLGWNSDYIL